MEAGRVGGGRSEERPKTFPRGRSLKAYRASRWSAIGLIGDPAQKTVLDEAGFLMEAFTNRSRRCLWPPWACHARLGECVRTSLRHRTSVRVGDDPLGIPNRQPRRIHLAAVPIPPIVVPLSERIASCDRPKRQGGDISRFSEVFSFMCRILGWA